MPELVIDDSTHWREYHRDVAGFGTGWIKPAVVGYGGTAQPFPDSLLLSWEEINDRASDRERNKAQLSHKIRGSGMRPLNQQQTEFCVPNAVTNNVRIMSMLANQPLIDLSPASVGCMVTGFQNVGMSARNVLDIVRIKGIVPAEFWPQNAISTKYNTADNWAHAAPFKVDKWIVLQPGNLQQLASLNVQDIPVPVAYDWWGHEVTCCDWLPDGSCRPWNSWGTSKDWQQGDDGWFLVRGNQRYFADGVAALSVTSGVAA